MARIPHLLLVCPRSDVLGKLLGLPVAVTVVHRPGGDRAAEQACALGVVDSDFTDRAALMATALEVHEQRPLDAVLGLTELSLFPTSVVGQAVGARGNPPQSVAYALDKASMRRRLADCGADSSAYRVCTSLQEAADFARRHPAGIVLKPVSGNGGTGVSLVRDPGELAAAWAWTTTATGGWGWSGGDKPRQMKVLAEEYLTGEEFSVETLSAAGEHHLLAVTRKKTSGPPHFVETGHELPAVLPDRQRAAIAGAALCALDAIGYQWGPAHTEVMLREDGERATVVEINVRQGGDQIWEMVHLAGGVDMIAGAVLTLAYGEAVLPGAPTHRGAAIRYLPAEPGRVVAVDGMADALAVDGVVRVGELREIGAEVPPLGDSWGRNGWVLAGGPDTASAVAAADLAVSRIAIRTVAEQPTDGVNRPAEPAPVGPVKAR